MDEVARAHLQRLRSATTNRYTREDLLRWVCTNTYLNGRLFSTKGHEYQERIMLDQSQEICVRKASQTGLSEMSLRMSLGLVSMIPNFSLIYTMPTATLASLYAKTRLDPIIAGSPVLRAAIRGELDSAESKQLGPNNFLYMRGAAVGNSAIAVSSSCIVNDELDFSDPHIIEMTNSRLVHSEYKWKIQLSTPTTPNGPIDLAFKGSRRHFNMVKCHKCNHQFIPNYWDDVKIPGYSGSLKGMTKELLSSIRYKEAVVVCPRCGGNPSLEPKYREWVCENPTQMMVSAGYQVSPFDAPSFISIPSLVEVSTKYIRPAQFSNFHLGETAEDSDSGMCAQDLDSIGVDGTGTCFTTHCMGVDLGLISHIAIGGMGTDQKLGVVHYERVPLGQFRERYFALRAQYRVGVTVADWQPYTDLLISLSADDPNLFAATYVSKNGMGIFEVKLQDADASRALGDLKQVNINRNPAFDKLMVEIREKRVWVRRTSEWELFKAHAIDMRRALPTLRNGEMSSMWQKSHSGQDHFFHSLLYLMIAAQMRGVAAGHHGSVMMGVHKFKLKQHTNIQDARAQGRVL